MKKDQLMSALREAINDFNTRQSRRLSTGNLARDQESTLFQSELLQALDTKLVEHLKPIQEFIASL